MIKVDLLPTERKKFGFDPVIAILVVLIALSVVVYYYFGVKLEKDISDKKGAISKVDGEIQSLQQQLPIIEKLKKENSELENQIATVKSLRYDPIRYSNLLDEVAYLLPRNMWLSNVTIEPTQTKVSLTGTAAELPGVRPLESISGFMKNVQRSKYFRSASLSGTSRGTIMVNGKTYPSYSFSFDMVYDPRAAEQMALLTSEREKQAENARGTVAIKDKGVEHQ
jgi:Tfp pilus assembly protein PilN